MPSVTIRDASRDDANAIRRVGEASWRAAYGDLLEPATIDAAIEEWYDLETVRAYVDRDDVAFFVAEDPESTVVGYVSGGPTEDEGVAVLAAIYVDPEHWGEGYGSALEGRFEEFCGEQGYDAIRLRVLAGNDVGRSFYQGRGYEPVEERGEDLFGERIEELVLRRELP